MKKLLLILLCLPMIGFGQSYYISEIVSDASTRTVSQSLRIYEAISNKLSELGKTETKQQESSTYTITPVITQGEYMYFQSGKGYIAFYESKSNRLLLRSKSKKGKRDMFNGMENPYFLLFNKIVKKQFPDLLKELEQMDIPIRSVSVIKEQVNNEDKYEKLLKLGRLRDDGILTDEEFEKEKKKILERE